MNLHAVVSGPIGAVNPHQPVVLQTSLGYTTDADGKQVPAYSVPVELIGQVQQLTVRDLMHLDSLNIQGSQRKIYLNGAVKAIERVSSLGGDMIMTQDGKTWLTTAVLEAWPDWVCVSVTMQLDGYLDP